MIFLHGVGSNGANLAGLGHAWRDCLPDTAFAAPDAPVPFDQGYTGRQWFSVQGATAANRPGRVLATSKAFDDVLHGIIEAQGFADRLDRVALVGFSQGSIMALDAVVSGRWPVAAVIAFSGRLASSAPFEPATATRVALIYSTADPIIPAADSISAAGRLEQMGVSPSLQLLDRIGHRISTEGARLAGAILSETIGSMRAVGQPS